MKEIYLYKLELFSILNKARKELNFDMLVTLRDTIYELKIALENLKLLTIDRNNNIKRSIETCSKILTLLVEHKFTRPYSKEDRNIRERISRLFNYLVLTIGGIE